MSGKTDDLKPGLREAKKLAAAMKSELAAAYPRSQDPFIRGQREALKVLDDRLKARIAEITAAA